MNNLESHSEPTDQKMSRINHDHLSISKFTHVIRSWKFEQWDPWNWIWMGASVGINWSRHEIDDLTNCLYLSSSNTSNVIPCLIGCWNFWSRWLRYSESKVNYTSRTGQHIILLKKVGRNCWGILESTNLSKSKQLDKTCCKGYLLITLR